MVGATAPIAGAGRMTSSRARESDMSLYADVLEPFRRVIGSVGGEEDREKCTTAARLSFTELENTTDAAGKEVLGGASLLGKRTSSAAGATTVTPVKRTRTDSDSTGAATTTPAASPWEAKRLRIELIASKARITKLESRINQQHTVRKEMQILFEEERQTAAEQQRRDRQALASLEERLSLVRRRETDLKEELAENVRRGNESKAKWDKEREDFQKQISELRDKVLEANVTCKGQVSEMKKDMDELLQALEGAQGEVEVLKREVGRQTARAQECAALRTQVDRQTLELQQLSTQLRDLQYERDSYKDWQQQAKTAQKRLSNMCELEHEVGRLRAEERSLRDSVRNKLLLEEQVASLSARLHALQPAQQELHAAKVKAAALESALEEWTGAARRRGARSAAELGAALDRALQRELAAVADHSALKSQLAQVNEELTTAKFERDKASTKLTEVMAVRKSQESLIHRLQKRLLLVTRERDSYRQQLDSYEKELSVTFSGEGGAAGAGGAALMSARIEQLERSLQGYRDLLNQTDQEAHTKVMERLRADATRWREEAEAAQRDVHKLRAQRDQLETQLHKLQVHSTKILHLEDNPAANAQKQLQTELEAAQEEIKRLKVAMQEGGQKEGEGGAGATVAALKKQIESSRIKMQRIKEEYTSSAQEYRDACYLLLGYKIDRTGHKNYKLSSMYAESSEEYLTFTLNDDGIEMVHTEYSASLEELVELHLHTHRSIPLFLSALTIDLFSHATVQQDQD